MLNKDILEILKQLREDCPDFDALENLNPNLASCIAYWIKEDREYIKIRTINQCKRKTRGNS